MARYMVRQCRGELSPRPKLDHPRWLRVRSDPVRDQFRTVRLPDADRYWLAAGLGYEWTSDLRFDAAYVHIFSGSAPISEISQTGDLLAGRFSDHADIVSVSA